MRDANLARSPEGAKRNPGLSVAASWGMRLKRIPMRRAPADLSRSDRALVRSPPYCQDARARNRAPRLSRHLTRNCAASEPFDPPCPTWTPSAPVDCSASSASFDHSSANLSHLTLLAASRAASARCRHRSADRRQAAGWLSGIVFASRRVRPFRQPSWQRADA
jgi:hypothetical protein